MTLWDLVRGAIRGPARAPSARGSRTRPARAAAAPKSMRARYESVTRVMLAEHGVRVRKWRTSMSGLAWEVRYRDGSVRRFIESPRPVGPMSAAIFLHEIGHHAIGFRRFSPRCLEEYHAWMFSLRAMEENGLNITEGVRRRVHESLHYAIGKAVRRGLKSLPAELEPYRARPEGRKRRG